MWQGLPGLYRLQTSHTSRLTAFEGCIFIMTIFNALRYRVPAVLFALAVSACLSVAKEDASFKKRSVVAKRELSDDQYNTYAIAHATGEF